MQKKIFTWISAFQHYNLLVAAFSKAKQNIAEFPSQFDLLKYGFAVVGNRYT